MLHLTSRQFSTKHPLTLVDEVLEMLYRIQTCTSNIYQGTPSLDLGQGICGSHVA